MIERVIYKRNINSVYNKHHVGIAELWEAYCEKHNGEISGIVNGYCLEFQLNLRIKNVNVQIDGHRQYSNATAGTSRDHSIIKSTVVNISTVYYGREDWEIYQTNKVLDLFNKIIGKCTPFIGAQGYSIASRKEIETLDNYGNFRKLFDIAEIRSISFSKETVRVEYFTLLGVQSAEEVISLINS